MYPVMTHTLIDYIFSLFQQFVKLTQNLYGVRFARVVEYMTAECVYLLEELVWHDIRPSHGAIGHYSD